MAMNPTGNLANAAEGVVKLLTAATAVLYGVGLAVAAIHSAFSGLEFPPVVSTRYPLVGFWAVVHILPAALFFEGTMQSKELLVSGVEPRDGAISRGEWLATGLRLVVVVLGWAVVYGLVLPSLLMLRPVGPYIQPMNAVWISAFSALAWYRFRRLGAEGDGWWRGPQPMFVLVLCVGSLTVFTATFFRSIPLALGGGGTRDAVLILRDEARDQLVAGGLIPGGNPEGRALSVSILDESGDRIAFRLAAGPGGLSLSALLADSSVVVGATVPGTPVPAGLLIVLSRDQVVAILPQAEIPLVR